MTYERPNEMFECGFVHIVHNFSKHARDKYQKGGVYRYEGKQQNLGQSLRHTSTSFPSGQVLAIH